MSNTPPPSPRAAPTVAPRRRRRWLWLAFPVAVLAAVAGHFFYQSYVHDRELQAAIAEADRIDPGWRLPELVARRGELPPDQNSAPHINKIWTAAVPALNKGNVRADLQASTKECEALKPTDRLIGLQAETLRGRLAPVAGPLAEARALVTLPRGRHAVNVRPGLYESVPHVDNAALSVWLLTLDVHLRTYDRDLPEAWASAQAIHNISRSFQDEPLWIAQSIRLYQRLQALRLMERVLAHGEVPEMDLAATQGALADELNETGALLVALRAHRAALHHTFTELAAGRTSLAQAQQAAAGSFAAPTWKDELHGLLGRGRIKPAHAWLLRHFNRAVEIARRADGAVEDKLAELNTAAAGAPELAQALAKLDRFLSLLSPRRTQVHLRAAGAMLAVERYRLRERRWPDALADVVAAGLLPQAPVDPYDGAPLRYRPTKDGVVLFSIGPDADGAGDALDRETDLQRLEFRLWNVEHRAARR